MTEKPRESQMSSLSLMFAALLLSDRRDFSAGVMASRRMTAALKISLVLLTKF